MIHMVKLCVGVSSVEELESYRDQRAHWWGADYGEDVHVHRTRMMPKRADEVLNGGSLYWVIKGQIAARQVLKELRPVKWKGEPHCGLVYDKALIPVSPRPRRPLRASR